MSGTMDRHRTWGGAIGSYVRREILAWPNLVTAIRVVCALGVVYWAGHHMMVFVLVALGAGSDALDGLIAKRFGLCTLFGKRFDQFADWGLGVAILYAVFVAEGLTWYNVPPLVAIGGYLALRIPRPIIDTTSVARQKTIVQYAGGVTILLGFALESMECLILGYALVWGSLWFMWKSLRDFLS